MWLRNKLIWILFIVLIFCSEADKKIDETILAKVGNKTISVNEFIRRAEYTIRPSWCKNDDYIARKVVLNSLIAEKLLALEAGEPKVLTENEEINLYLQGRKEQAMRQVHFDEVATKHADLSNTDLSTPLLMTERTYNVTIIPINDDHIASRITEDIKFGKTNFTALSKEFASATGQDLKEQIIRFDTPVDDAVYSALFMNETFNEQVIGPLKIEKDHYSLIRINGWNRRAVISEKEAAQMYTDLKEKISGILAKDIYINWITETMKGKELNFNPKTLEKLLNIIGPDYFKTTQNKEQAFNKKFWTKDDGKVTLDNNTSKIEEILDEPLLNINQEVWTVSRFEKEIKKHPLVFRNKKMVEKEFTNEFRLAVADLIRDIAITEDSYEKKYDSDPRVVRNTSMWQDNILSLYQRRKILEKTNQQEINQMSLVQNHLDPYLQELRKKYNNKIFINTESFENISLTSVDMFVIQRNKPFPVTVPQFPIVTTHNKLDYGEKM